MTLPNYDELLAYWDSLYCPTDDYPEAKLHKDIRALVARAPLVDAVVEDYEKCINELESSGYCWDHPSLVGYRKTLAALRKSEEEGGGK